MRMRTIIRQVVIVRKRKRNRRANWPKKKAII